MDSSDERSFVFDQAGTEDREQVLSLYHSVIGSEYCTWNANYPGMYEIQADIENADLFVFRDGVKIIGAISIVPENELDALEIWRNKDGKLAEIARVAVAPNYQGKGLALIMVRETEKILRQRDYRAVHLLAARINLPACHTYQKSGYQKMGECEMFGHEYYAFEKELEI
jgi:ribosomal protein S18 acetylase RimI-like enzyme